MERGLCDWWICVERKGMVVPFLKFNFIHSFFFINTYNFRLRLKVLLRACLIDSIPEQEYTE